MKSQHYQGLTAVQHCATGRSQSGAQAQLCADHRGQRGNKSFLEIVPTALSLTNSKVLRLCPI
jgi:hypothetical protein